MESAVRFFQSRSLGVIPRTQIRKTLVAASKGSNHDCALVSRVISNLRAGDDVIGVLTLFGGLLEVPTFDPTQQLTPAENATRELVFLSLLCISCLALATLRDAQAPGYSLYVVIWPNILGWMRYFCNVLTPTPVAGPSLDPESYRNTYPDLFVILGMFVQRVDVFYEHLYQSAILEGGFLDLIVKAWLRTEDQGLSMPELSSDYPRFNAIWLKHLWRGLTVVHDMDKIGLLEARKMIIREAGGDATFVVNRILRHIKHPNKANKDRARHFDYVISIVSCLCNGWLREGAVIESEFMGFFLKEDIVRLAIRLLFFVVDDISRPLQDQLLDEEKQKDVIKGCFAVLHHCELTKNGKHWAMVMLKLGFLSAVASVLAFPTFLDDLPIGMLSNSLSQNFPIVLYHRPVIVAATRAVRDITIDDGIKNLQSGFLKDAWERFENVLLERTVFNAIYERDFAHDDFRQCFTCGKSSQQTALAKCAGCGDVVYCSKDCQALAWRELGHRQICKANPDFGHGAGKKGATFNFQRILGAFELHRHAPGIAQQLSTKSNWSRGGDPSQDPWLNLDFNYIPPISVVRTAQYLEQRLLERELGQERIRPMMDVVHETAGRRLLVLVSVARGLETLFSKHFFAPRSFIEGVEGKVYDPGDETDTPNSKRMSLKDENGKAQAFVTDEIDAVIADARANFHSPAPGDDAASPKTIYEYVRQKVAERQPEAWTKRIRILRGTGERTIHIEEENDTGMEEAVSD